MRRREFITLLGGVAAMWPPAARAQQGPLPVVGFISSRSNEEDARPGAAFRKGLNESGYVEGQNVTVEYHWLAGQYHRLPALLADLVRRRVAVIAIPGVTSGAADAKAATATIPIVFGVGEDSVKLGLVASLARPDSNATGVNFFVQEINSKRLALLHELLPKATRIAVLVNPDNPLSREVTLKDLQKTAPPWGLRSRSSMLAAGAKSMLPLPLLRANVPTRFSSGATDSSPAVACNLPR